MAENRVFGKVKSITGNCAKTSSGYILKVIFFIDLDESTPPEVIKFRCTAPSECAECINLVIENHSQMNPGDKLLMGEWVRMVSEFEDDPLKGISLYRPG